MRTITTLLALAAPLALIACEQKEAPAPAEPAQTQAAPQNPPMMQPTQPSAPASLPTPAPDTGLVTVQGISFKPAPEWTAVPPAMQMRAAEYDIPGDEGDASLAIFRFPGGAGTINANLERWCGQFAQPDGSNSMEHAQIEQTEVNGHAVHTIWLTGTYVAAMTPGAPVSNNNPGWALLGAIVETPDSHYYFKAIGPEATLEANREAFDQMVASFQTP